jgi:hypothetical protein
MTRTLYEKALDIGNEHYIADMVTQRWGCGIQKLPISYGLDYAAHRDTDRKIRFWLEIKRRNVEWHQYSTVFLSLLKVREADWLCRATRLPAFFVVLFNDALVYTQIVLARWPVALAGRTDRNDWQDQEAVQLIPREAFAELTPPCPTP